MPEYYHSIGYCCIAMGQNANTSVGHSGFYKGFRRTVR